MDTLVGKDEGNIHVNICTTLCEADHGFPEAARASFISRANDPQAIVAWSICTRVVRGRKRPP
jgi:hypothetical protein